MAKTEEQAKQNPSLMELSRPETYAFIAANPKPADKAGLLREMDDLSQMGVSLY